MRRCENVCDVTAEEGEPQHHLLISLYCRHLCFNPLDLFSRYLNSLFMNEEMNSEVKLVQSSLNKGQNEDFRTI